MDTLLLPGMDGTGALFTSLAQHLEPTLDARVISYPVDVPLGYEELLERIEAPSGPFSIVAESFSGPLGIRLARRYADRVRGLVLVATFVRSPSRLVGAMSAIGPMLFRLKMPSVAIRHALLGCDAGADEVAAVQRAIARVHPNVLSRRLLEIEGIEAEEDLASCGVPMMYIAGAFDRLVGTRGMDQVRSIRADIELRTLDAPHLVLQRRPAEAAALISAFLLSADVRVSQIAARPVED